MPDYKSMYFKLYGVHCDVLERLQQVTQETETMAMDAPDPLPFPKSPQDERPEE